ncbi:metabotropic glutamate receptor 1 [Trichonephila clavipes]|nr:metabotropic glutamate receptor 1 [Trichonephila clavipes]
MSTWDGIHCNLHVLWAATTLRGQSCLELRVALQESGNSQHANESVNNVFALYKTDDGWSDRNDVTEEYEKEALGGISIRIHSTYDRSFDPYYFSLKPHNNSRNPWFREFWEYRFNCSLPNGSGKYNKTCSGHENLQERYKQDTKMSFVKKAIYTMAYGLHDMQQAKCNTSGLCADMLPLNGSLFLQYLLNVSFVWENETVKFDENGDPPGRYDIMNFQFIPENNSYDYKHVGSWDSGKLDIFQPFRWNPQHVTNGLPESVCSKPCERGKVKSIQSESVKCCWVCVACKENQYLEDEFTCKDCDLGWWPNDNLTDCDRIPVDYIQWSDSTAIVSVTIAVLGMIATFFTMVVFIMHNNTPVVKASTRELSYVILVGMYFCHSCTFPLLAKPTHTSCFLTRIMPGLSFAMMYASLVTKTNRIARILAGSKKKIITKKPRFMSGTAQVVITWLLISIESSIIGAMLVLEPADSMFAYPSLDKVELICNTTPLGIIAPLGFDFFLIAMCTVYAVKTRNVPENFNEAKFIGFTMYTTLVIWVAFVPIYFGSNSKVITLCLCISFSAIVALVLLFFPKLYIILLRPEKNNRSAFTTTKDVRCHIGRGYPTAATVSRNSSHSTSEFSLESPRNLSLDMVHKNQKSEPASRRPSMNLFVRLRISKQDKIAANVAQHIRAVRAAEALDRRTRLRRTDSFNFPGLPSTILPVQRSTSSGEDSPKGHEKKRLVGMIKQAYAEEVIEEMVPLAEDVACQTSYDLLEALLPTLRRRIMRSETSMTNDDEDMRYASTPCKMGGCYHKRPAYADGARHHSVCDPTHGPMNAAYDTTSFTSRSSSRPRSRNKYPSDGREDRVEVEYKVPSDSDLLDYDIEEVISLREMKRSKALQLLGKKGQYNKLQATGGDGTSLGLPQEGVSEASFSPTVSQDSLIDATSSIVEESASTGSDETSGSAVYKNIIINLGGNQDKSTRGLFSASHSSTTSAANLNLLPTIADSRMSHSQENVNEGGKRSSPDVTKWSSPNGNPKGLAM